MSIWPRAISPDTEPTIPNSCRDHSSVTKLFSCHFRQRLESHRTDSHELHRAKPGGKRAKPGDNAHAAWCGILLGALGSLRVHWPEYLMEAGLLGAFMVSACIFGALYEFPHSPVRQAITSQFFRRMLMGTSMGLTAIAIIYSPWGKQSGAHINPCVTFTFFRLEKVKLCDAIFYIAAQFTGAVLGVLFVVQFLSKEISDPAVRYVVTVPGPHGPWVALLAEFIIAFGLMSTVLYFSNHHRLYRYTGLFAGLLVATYITLEAPFSGIRMNPSSTFDPGLSPQG